jgi:hypothetical protein
MVKRPFTTDIAMDYCNRTLSIMLPLKCAWKPSNKTIWISFGCITIILVILNCLWMFKIKNSEIILTRCSEIPEKMNSELQLALNMWALAILPFIFTFVCNALILFKMFQMTKIKAVTRRGHRNEVFATFTILTVVTGLLHCVSVIPKMLYLIAINQDLEYGHNFLNLNNYDDSLSRGIFWSYFSHAMILFNNSFNFYVYCLAGRDFRKDVRHLLTCCSTRNNTRV